MNNNLADSKSSLFSLDSAYRFSWLIFGVGCGLSQSLMSLGSTMLCLWFFYFYFQSPFRSQLTKLESYSIVLMLAYVMVSFAKLCFDLPFSQAVDRASPLPLFLLVFLPLFRPFSREQMWSLLSWTFVCYMINVFYAGYQYFGNQIEGAGFFKNPIFFAYNVFPAFLFVGLFVRFQGDFLKTYRIPFVALVLFLGVAFSNNRMTLALSGLLLVYCYLPRLFARWRWKGLAVAILSICVLFFVMYYSNPWLKDKIVRSSWGLQGPSIQARLVAWKYNLALFVDNPFFGVGYRLNGINTAELVEYQKHWRPGYDIFAHSVFIQSLAESGGIGFLLFFGSLFCLAKSRFFVQRFFLFMGLAGLTENFLHNSKPLSAFMFFVAMSVAVAGLSFNQQSFDEHKL